MTYGETTTHTCRRCSQTWVNSGTDTDPEPLCSHCLHTERFMKLTWKQVTEVDGLIYAGAKLAAVKTLKEFSGLGLRDSLDLVEWRSGELWGRYPEKFKT